jgi:CPA2 family monovalent cation:H+ antiporter-2
VAGSTDTPVAILELGGVMLLGAVFAWAARRLGLPSLTGFIAAGLVVAPVTPGLAISHSELELAADLGVLLLLFEAGVEIDVRRLARSGLAVAAPLQVLLTTALVAAAAMALGLHPGGGVLLGASVALSSGLAVLHIVNSRRRTTNPETERALLDWSAIQDLTGVALVAIALVVFGFEGKPDALVAARLAVYALVAVGAAWLLPRALRAFHADPDLVVLLSVGGALTLAGLGAAAFLLPLPLAAFVGGAVAGSSPEMEVVREHLRPFRELFAALFLVTLPTLIEPGGLQGAAGWIVFVVLAVVVAKSGVIVALARVRRVRGVRPVQLGLGLGQLGEFSFVIAVIARDHGDLPAPAYEAVLVTLVAGLGVSGLLARLGGGRTAGTAEAAGR